MHNTVTGAKKAKSTDAPSANLYNETVQVVATENTATDVTEKELLASIDKWLTDNNYNQYGDPIGTLYIGGTPLFDESTGVFTDRLSYLLHKFPALANYNDNTNATDPSIDGPLPTSNTTQSDTGDEECPCFDRGNLMWAFNKMAGFNMDVLKDLSCDTKDVSSTLRILFADIDTADLMGGIQYTDLSVIYDDELGNSQPKSMCSNGKTSMSLNPEQAKTCHTLLYEACQSIRSKTCPCFDLFTLEDFVQDAVNKDIDIDLVHSCKGDTYSILTEEQVQCIKAPCSPISVLQYGVQKYPQMCLNKDLADSAQYVTSQQDVHCRKLLHRSCEVIDKEIIQPNTQPTLSECNDLAFYEFRNKDDLSCAWVSKDKHRRCASFDDYAGNNVFENCRETCGYCSCKDDQDPWGQSDLFNCTWVAEKPQERCNSEIARTHCRETCGNCCKDNPKFKWWGNPYFTCEWVYGKESLSGIHRKKRIDELCGYNAIAQNCPSTYGKCPSEGTITPEPVTVCPCFDFKSNLGPAINVIKSGSTENHSIQCNQVNGNRNISFNVPDQPFHHSTMYGTNFFKVSESVVMQSCYRDNMHWVNTEKEFNTCNALLDEACAQLSE